MQKPKKSVGVMNIILVIIAVTLVVFTAIMIKTFWLYGAIPDTLCTCVFGVLGTECGAMAWIKTTKDKHTSRKQELEDREYYGKRNGGKGMTDKKTDTTEEIKDFPKQDTFNADDMTADETETEAV